MSWDEVSVCELSGLAHLNVDVFPLLGSESQYVHGRGWFSTCKVLFTSIAYVRYLRLLLNFNFDDNLQQT